MKSLTSHFLIGRLFRFVLPPLKEDFVQRMKWETVKLLSAFVSRANELHMSKVIGDVVVCVIFV